MAQKFLLTIVGLGSRVLYKAAAQAWMEAQHTHQYAKAGAAFRQSQSNASNYTDPSIARKHAGMTLQEACQILNVKPPQGGKADMNVVMERFKKLYDKNEEGNGGSFYLQSKVLRARERIEDEVRAAIEKEERESELNRGWKPKIYK